MPTEKDVRLLSEEIIRLLLKSGLTLCTAESCTGGWIGKCITDVPGSSAVFAGGVIAYSNAIKISVLGVDPLVLDTHGAVSAQTVSAMASGARDLFSADLAISVSGIAGPDGGSAEKPVGLVYIGLCSGGGTRHFCHQFDGDRMNVRLLTVDAAFRHIAEEIALSNNIVSDP